MPPLRLAEVDRRLRRRTLDWQLEYHAECSSTQDLARDAALAGGRPGLVVVSDTQRSGRGRQGTSWSAPGGRALLFSTIIQPPPSAGSLLPLYAGVAVFDGIEAATGLRMDLKWPNDIQHQGRKLAGILCERPPGPLLVLGIGVNVNLSRPELPVETATSLSLALGHDLEREPLLAAVLNALDDGFGRLAGTPADWVVAEWRLRTSMLGQPVTYIRNGQPARGIAEDVDLNGGLIVLLEDGRRESVLAGEVQQVRRTN